MNPEQRKALLFALVAERLSAHYDHGYRITLAQGSTLAGDWLARNKLALPLVERRAFSDLSDDIARELMATLSPQAGLFTAHEMTEALDPRYKSAITEDLLDECGQRLRQHGLDGTAPAS